MSDDRQTAVRAVLAAHPKLQNFGFGVFDRRGKTAEEIAADIEAGRAEMLEERSLMQFAAARAWLRQFPKLKHFNRSGTSYGLKHVAEDAIGYVTNGVFIAAGVAEGFRIERSHPESPNVYFNISMRAWRRRK